MDNPALPEEPVRTSASPLPVSQPSVSQPTSPSSSPPVSSQLPSFIDLLKQSFQILKSNWKPIIALWGISIGVTLCLSLVTGGVAFLAFKIGVDAKIIFAFALVLYLPVILAGTLFFASHTLLINDAVANRPTNALASLKQAFSKLGLIGITQIGWFLTIMGVAFIPILPIVLGIGLMFTVFIALSENIGGYYALSRSWQLTRGHRTKMFIYGLYFSLVFIVVAIVNSLLMATIVLAPVAFVVNLAIFLIWMIFICLLYQNIYHLKQSEVFVKKINPWFIVSSVFAVVWIVVGSLVFLKFGTFSFNFSPINDDLRPKISDFGGFSSEFGTFSDDSPSPSPAFDSSDPALAKYDQDSDGNFIPDFIEEALGLDPLTDDCIKDVGCERGEVGEYESKINNTLLILDSSGSMGLALGGETRMAVAKTVIKEWINNFSVDENIGLMVYGHKGSNSQVDKTVSCQGIELLYPLAPIDKQKFIQAVDSFQPTGWTPIADALLKAKNKVFTGRENENNRIILISDGIEMCDGNPIAVATELKNSNVSFVVDVVGLSVDSVAQNQLRQVAEITGGQYYSANSRQEFKNALEQYLRNLWAISNERACLSMNYSNWVACMNLLNGKVVTNLNFSYSKLRMEGKTQEANKNREILNKINAHNEEEIKKLKLEYDQRYQQNLEDLDTNESQNNPYN